MAVYFNFDAVKNIYSQQPLKSGSFNLGFPNFYFSEKHYTLHQKGFTVVFPVCIFIQSMAMVFSEYGYGLVEVNLWFCLRKTYGLVEENLWFGRRKPMV